MLRGRPLYDTDADRRYFVVPDQWNEMMRALDHGNNVLISGARGSGKTSLLRQAQHAMRTQREPVVFVDANAVESLFELVVRVRQAVAGEPPATETMRGALSQAALVIAGDPSPPPAGLPRALFGELESVAEADPTTILVDASGSADAVYGLFGRMRDTLWQMPHHWVVGLDEEDLLSVLKPPADAFFDSVLRLNPLSIEGLLDMLHRREVSSELDDSSLWEIVTSAGGNPRTALRAANAAVVSGRPPGEAMSERAHLLDAAARLGRPHGMLMAELLDIGQASPSDDALRDRLGLSRGRVTALLRQLLNAGLVEAGADKSAGPGRPRTIYRPKLRASA
jgi:energy-coupling factor transporter ATP-binding protein EcfA2